MSFTIRKFYDTAVAEPSTGAATGVQPSIASLMAIHGIKSSSQEMVATPIEIKTEKKEETPKPATEHTPEETSTDASNVEKVKTETPTPQKEPLEVKEPQKVEEPVKVQSWQDNLKSQQPDTVLKAVGYDDKEISLLNALKGFEKIDYFTNLVNTWKENGNVDSYFKELSTDYEKMAAEDVMRHQLRQDYPKASEKAIEALYNKEIVNAYNLNSDDEEEVETGRLLLEAKADKYRDSFIENQQKYLTPKTPEPKQPQPDPREQEAAKEFEAYKSKVNDNPYTKNIFSTNKITIGEGDDKFSFPVEPSTLTDILFDTDKWAESVFTMQDNEDGSKSYVPDVEKQMLVAAVAKYGDKFLKAYAKHYKALGGKASIDPIENAKQSDNNSTPNVNVEPKSIAEAMAKSGKYNSGGYR